MNFSERKGYTEVSKIIQRDGMSIELRNSLWNLIHPQISQGFIDNYVTNSKQLLTASKHFLWFRDEFLELEWFSVYDLLELLSRHYNSENLNAEINIVLAREFSGYRLINGTITDVTDKQEIEMLENALNDENLPNVKAHLQRALELLSDKRNPDYRNSIKESISAVESIAKEIAQTPKAELGDALKEIEKQGKLHGAIKKAFLNLYGYTSDANGIRHALMEEPNLTADDAKFFLLTCTSFINYLKAKM